jgi:hypothetical protein
MLNSLKRISPPSWVSSSIREVVRDKMVVEFVEGSVAFAVVY